jgi:chromosome segregation ATPase
MEKTKNTKQKAYDCMFYSKVLKEPFNSIEELMEAEEAYYAKLKAKEDKAAEKKADATKVEEAFKALNAARKSYKDNLNEATQIYSKGLVDLKEGYEKTCATIKETLAVAEASYQNALKAFADKYPEGYHITLRDGDFETTISSQTSGNTKATVNRSAFDSKRIDDLFNLIFNF